MMSKHSGNSIFVWVGGVITEKISEITMQILRSKQGFEGTTLQRSEITKLADELSLGLVSTNAFCKGVIRATNSDLDEETLEDLIPRNATLNTPVIDLVSSISRNYEKWLISDYPESWFQKISSRLDLSSQYPNERIIFVSHGGLKKIVPDVFDYISLISQRSLDECLLIDSMYSRAVGAVRHGLSSIIYVYPERLEHEFALRGILETDVEVLHPETSRRVDI